MNDAGTWLLAFVGAVCGIGGMLVTETVLQQSLAIVAFTCIAAVIGIAWSKR